MTLTLAQSAAVALLLLSFCGIEFCLSGPCSDRRVLSVLTKGGVSWNPEPCTRCSCSQDGQTQCTSVPCHAPYCSPNEVLTLNSTGCCPVCAPLYKDCVHNGLTIKHGESNRDGRCQQCTCTDGGLQCSILPCSQVQCSSRTEDACCRNCSSNMCYDEGKVRADNSTWTKGRCILCECRQGVKTCFPQVCPKLNCKQSFTPEGACCPICPNRQCWSKGVLYEATQQWEESCRTCFCARGRRRCSAMLCSQPACDPGLKFVLGPGECCPSCVPEAGICVKGNSSYYNGQLWNSSKCEYCACRAGSISCQRVQCSLSSCADNEYLERMEGACCPVCKKKEVCLHDGLLRTTKAGEVWVADDCRHCLCKDGVAQCYEDACPSSTPTHGTLHGGNKEFSYRELSDGLRYQHDGGAEPDDFALLQASDSENLQNVLLPIHIQSSKDLTMVNNVTLSVQFGQRKLITSANLRYEAGGGGKSHQIDYALADNPEHGSLVMILPQPDSGLQSGWTGLVDGTMLRPVTKFRQLDINNGYIFYQHNSANQNATNDSFTFKVVYQGKDKDTKGSLTDQMYIVNILPAKVYDAPSLSAGSSLGLRAFEGETVTLIPAHISFVDSDTSSKNIVFDITKPLLPNQGTIAFKSKPEVPIKRFTQLDINSGLVVYRTGNMEVGFTRPTYSFKFNVTDDTGRAIPMQQFNILILPVDNKAPSVGSGVRVNVERDRSVLVNDALLRVTDVDTVKTELEFALTSLPKHGDIVKISTSFNILLNTGVRYSYTEVLSNTLYYVHKGSTELEDNFTLQLFDSAQSKEAVIPVTIQYSDMDSPTLSSTATMKLRLNEGERKVITPRELEYTDASADGLVFYQIAYDLSFGKLFYKTQVMKFGDGFTQSDVASKHISYQADKELGNLEIMDVVYLNVSDSSGNMAAMQPLAISIKATDNHPPLVSIHADLKVEEGRRKQLTKGYISAEDPDSILTNLMVVVDSVPTLGKLKIITQDTPGEGVRESRVQMFLLSDLYAGIVYYEQSDHKNKEPRSDFFWFHMTDGENISPVARFNITILPRNDEAPSIVTDTLFVVEGDTVPLTNSSIYVNDIDTEFDNSPAEVHVFTLNKAPMEGKLLRKGGANLAVRDTFNMQDVLTGDILYTHNGGEHVSRDAFTVTVSDGYYEDTKQVPVDIALLDDETPRLKINDGLRMKVGGEKVIDSSVLHATDIDSDDELLLFTISQPIHRGVLYKASANGTEEDVVVFSPADLQAGSLKYRNDKTINRGGFDYFKFDVVDKKENKLMDQVFYIGILADTTVPTLRVNAPLSVKENSFSPITTSHMYITDAEASPDHLTVHIDSKPKFGNLVLEDDRKHAKPVTNFTMADIIANRIFYVHESEQEGLGDAFTFTASDGFNNLTQSFRIRLIQVDDSLPVLTLRKLMATEGQKKPLTEFDLKVTDNDTKDELLTISLLTPPAHGSIVLTRNGVEVNSQCMVFTMADIYNGIVSYKHDNTETTADSFMFSVTDKTNDGFFLKRNGKLIRTNSPLTMEISIQLLDDGMPRVVTNKGIPYLEVNKRGKKVAKISQGRLKIVDPDTTPNLIVIKVTRIPRDGILSKLPNITSAVSQFTQEDVNNGLIVYTLNEDGVSENGDSFEFSVMDSKPNTVSGLTFHISWSTVEFSSTNITATEQQSIIELSVERRGSANTYATVGCELKRVGTEEHHRSDLTVLTPQIQFEKGDNSAVCRISIVNDTVYEGTEEFVLKLTSPDRVLLRENSQASIRLTDLEDEPVIEFMKTQLRFNESVGTAQVPIKRAGDSSQSMTVLCSTVSQTAVGSKGNQLQTGSDYISRKDHVIRFEQGETISNCDIRILDDTLYEVNEEFEVVLSGPSLPAKLGTLTTATVFISGPNDASYIQMAVSAMEIYEDDGRVIVDIKRSGLDLSKPATVWCTTSMVSKDNAAKPGVDYVPISRKIAFVSGQSTATCEVAILDDMDEPVKEGLETFAVTIAAADSRSLIGEPSTTLVTIDDSDLDVPELSFTLGKHTVKEDSGKLSIPIVRTGDVSCTVSAICYTRQQTAGVKVDYQERTLTNSSRVELLAGERTGSCELEIVDDLLYETSEFLLVRLAEPLGCEAITGDLDVTLVTVLDPEDEPFISLMSASYSTREPLSATDSMSVKVHVSRSGDLSQSAQVRVSTRDKSAVSGIDYAAMSTLLQFAPNEESKSVEIGILYNPEVEWQESFVVVLESLQGGAVGANGTAVINILDTDTAGSLVLPAIPVVVSLRDYESGRCSIVTEVSPGYPLICLSPCDPLYPHYSKTEDICKNSKINSSSLSYGWEVSYPVQSDGKVSSYLKVAQATFFSRVDTELLETFYFRAGFNVRCIAMPRHPDGQSGVPIRSPSVSVHSKGICSSAAIPNAHGSIGAQSFTAKLDYVDSETDGAKANRIHVSVEVPHQDGMLPVISTMPIYNVDYLLTQSAFTKQHICSNLPNTSHSTANGEVIGGFLGGSDLPHSVGSPTARVQQAVRLYKHLNRLTCRWKFEAWFDLTEIVNYCGGRVTHNFDIDSASKSFVTVHQPLHVSYIFAKAPMGWATLDHQTTLEVSFHYDNVKFQSGVDIMQEPKASVEIIRVGIGEDGKMSVQFRTLAKFRGLLVTNHFTASADQTAQLVPPKSVDTRFNLRHIWSQPTFDGPVQIWRATSRYSLQDYSGTYKLRLLACVANTAQSYSRTKDQQKCVVKKVLSMPLNIAFQQSNRPVPLLYSLSTQFQLTNSKRLFLMNPQTANVAVSGRDFHGVFRKGERLFGRVFWNPKQDLESAFRLQLDKVFICAGRDGYAPTYDPSGKIYNEGPQYGCLEPSSKLKHRFLLLDRGQEEVTTRQFNGLQFKANFADSMTGLAAIHDIPGTDGFVMSVDPLFAATSGQRWHIHILYRIGTAESILHGRRRRSLDDKNFKVGTNLITINLEQNTAEHNMAADETGDSKVMTESIVKTEYVTNTTVIVVLLVIVLLVILSSVGIVIYVRRRTYRAAHAGNAGTVTVTKGTGSTNPHSVNSTLPPSYDQATRISLNAKVVGTAV